MVSHQQAVERDWPALYALGELPDRERDQFEEHLFDCPVCSQSVKTSYLLLRGIETTLKRPLSGKERPEPIPVSQPKAVRRSWPRMMIALPYAAAVCLAVAAGSQYLALQRALAPQAIVAFAVPPQAKGSSYQIRLPKTGAFVELDLDLVKLAPQFHWKIGPDGAAGTVMQGDAHPPAGSAVLKLLLPVDKLRPGRYTAVLSAPPAEETLYPFEILD